MPAKAMKFQSEINNMHYLLIEAGCSLGICDQLQKDYLIKISAKLVT